jgi:hypothetical protein
MQNYINTYYLNGKLYNKNIYFKEDALNPDGFECFADPEFYIKLKIVKIPIKLLNSFENNEISDNNNDDNISEFIKQINCFFF